MCALPIGARLCSLVLLALLYNPATVLADTVSKTATIKQPPQETDVVELTDANFDDLTGTGEWMIDIFAPWCPHCRDLEKTWAALATELKGSIHIGKIDGTKEKALMQRFDVEAFPTIYHLRTGETRQYDGKRTLPALLEFARGGWQEVKPLPFYQAPNSLYGRISGRLLGLPNQAKEYYIYLHQEKHYSQLVLLASFLAVPITIGMGLICALDAYYSRQPHPWTPPVARAHHD